MLCPRKCSGQEKKLEASTTPRLPQIHNRPRGKPPRAAQIKTLSTFGSAPVSHLLQSQSALGRGERVIFSGTTSKGCWEKVGEAAAGVGAEKYSAGLAGGVWRHNLLITAVNNKLRRGDWRNETRAGGRRCQSFNRRVRGAKSASSLATWTRRDSWRGALSSRSVGSSSTATNLAGRTSRRDGGEWLRASHVPASGDRRSGEERLGNVFLVVEGEDEGDGASVWAVVGVVSGEEGGKARP
ncbi:hypothetical protein MPTK1_6g05300 [Marchantia polymorpha subsp. ruderalis]|uniref:Uncharacterized protein n=2 Tax=Marchantia polymorpha TaxID=3197 RepID=A0AAF6BNR8_MARPO|nr:hypothetical protein MARPO_0167s0013 [Marchantia polymorpha]BBN13652.1 hypothetical protein Mp_6g05300 [Marchantia polymorpha subsp. ruderalis]|eukprot:PTQ28321.1 hypothetical protein MARPO_0167s0013 [Marchantia polymorpha]